jgi:hypothetical protein
MNINLTVVHRSLLRWVVLSFVLLSLTAASMAQVFVSVRIGPPALPIYAQPICPGPGYFWTPGFWAWNDDGGYYWVPGTWVVAPVGMLWTPGYWGWGGGFYAWHAGYWGPHVGFYGGINYGFGYGGVGFAGGEWRGGGFYYNRSVTNVSVTNVTNVYNKTVIVNENHTAFNGGEGGVTARATAEEEAAAREQHTAPLAAQTQHEQMASQNRQNFAAENHGRPAIAATAKPGDFSSRSAVPARAAGAEYHAPAMSPKESRVATPPANAGNKGNANEGFRPFTPPNKSGSAGAVHENKMGGTNPLYESRDKTAAPPSNPSRPNNTNSRPPAPKPQKSSPPPKRQNPPKEHKGMN